MIATLAFLLAAQTSKPPLVAYVARYYKTSGKSHDQVYVCDLDGGHRRVVTNGTIDAAGVRWAGPNRLVWFSIEGEKIRKWTKAWPNGKATSEMLQGEPWHLHEDFSDFGPESAILDKSDTPFMIQPETGEIVSPPKINPLGLVVVYDQQKGSGTVKGVEFTWELKDLKLILSSGQKKWEFPFEGSLCTLYWDAKREILWVREWMHDSTTGPSATIYKLNFENHDLTKVVDGASQLAFWPTRDLYLQNKPRDLAPFGKKQVWVSPLIVGNQRTGTKKTIVSGLVWVQTVSLQPVP